MQNLSNTYLWFAIQVFAFACLAATTYFPMWLKLSFLMVVAGLLIVFYSKLKQEIKKY